MLDLQTVLRNLGRGRPIFHSEADFQLALGWAIRQHYPEAQVRLEVPYESLKGAVDLIIRTNMGLWAIELKYFKAGLKGVIGGEQFRLPGNNPPDTSQYEFLKDLTRMERLVSLGEVKHGVCIMLSNAPTLWMPLNIARRRPMYAPFHLFEGRRIRGKLDWEGTPSEKTRRNFPPLEMQREYNVAWNEYATLTNLENGTFRYLVLEVGTSQ